MTEVSSWSATDASNNLTPPDGWPEGMQPSGVNDVGRMMMGAIRRWYNTVSAGIANCLPLSGGTLTGPLTVPGLHSTGAIAADGNVTGQTIYASATLSAGGDIYGRNVTASGNVTVSGAVAAASLDSSSNIHAAGEIHCDGIIYGGAINSASNIIATGVITASLNLISHGGLIVDHDATIAGSLAVTGNITANTYQLAGANFASHGVDGAGPVHSVFDPGGLPALDMYGTNGTYYRCGNAHSFTNRGATLTLARFQSTDGVCQNASGSWNVFSDRSVKENLADYTAGLSAVVQLNPKSFNYVPGVTSFAVAGTYYGLVAQEVEPVLPEMISADDETGIATLAPTHLVYVLINAVKELEARLAQVENRGG